MRRLEYPLPRLGDPLVPACLARLRLLPDRVVDLPGLHRVQAETLPISPGAGEKLRYRVVAPLVEPKHFVVDYALIGCEVHGIVLYPYDKKIC